MSRLPEYAYEFCTIADRRFLTQTVALAASLAEVCSAPRLQVCCLDEASYSALGRLAPAGVELLRLRELEAADPALRPVKAQRSRAEYCWTIKPSLCRFLLRREAAMTMLTYVDSDLMFLSDPADVLSELADASVLIFPQRLGTRQTGWGARDRGLSASSDLLATFGAFNAGTITFRNDARADAALGWWRERCLEWCFDRPEPGRWADQAYLDEFPTRFDGVRVVSHPGAALAPWNTHRVALRYGDRLEVDDRPAIFHHYQSVRLWRPHRLWPRRLTGPNVFKLGRGGGGLWARHDRNYLLKPSERRLLWAPYIEALRNAQQRLDGVDQSLSADLARPKAGVLMRDIIHAAYLGAYERLERRLPRWQLQLLAAGKAELRRRAALTPDPRTP